MTPTPPRVLEIIDDIAAHHETTRDAVLRGARKREAVAARHEAIKTLAATPKPSGKMPTIRELARWLDMTPAGVSRVKGGA